MVHAVLTSPATRPRAWQWRLNESLLQDIPTAQAVSAALTNYFQENDTAEVSPLTLWAAHKCVIRGVLVQHGSRIKKERSREIAALIADVVSLEQAHKRTHAIDTQSALLVARKKLRERLDIRTKYLLARGRRHFYEFGNRCSRTLARSLREQKTRNYIPSVTDSTGRCNTDPHRIAEEFAEFYRTLYNLPSCPPEPNGPSLALALRQYIVDSGMPKLSAEAQTALDSPITKEELAQALQTMQPSKAPGPDGFPASYYKKYSLELLDPLVRALNSLSAGATLPPDMTRAHITVIHKEGKDPALCASYRPISLLNVDLKIFSKVIACRLAPLLPGLVQSDQAGFIPTREARDNTVKVINAIHYAKTHDLPLCLLSTDAEKAFDRVSWSFLFEVLDHVGLGPIMRSWIGSLYSNPSASTRVNGIISSPFPIGNGTRQGCPLSPLIFVLTLEPLLRKIRSNPDIGGLRIGSRVLKIAAYADDLLFFLQDPAKSLPPLMSEFCRFCQLTNFKINFQKSEALNVSLPQGIQSSLETSLPFRWSRIAIKYLGVMIPRDLGELYEKNFLPLLRAIRSDLRRWSIGTYTWFGRCAIYKMNIMPRLLYLFQTLPIHIPPGFFKLLYRDLINFVWQGGRARLARSTLTLPKQWGGLGIPDPRKYYEASMLQRVLDWCRHAPYKQWVSLENVFVDAPLDSIPWLESLRPGALRLHPTIGPTLRVCRSLFCREQISPSPSPLLPILGNPAFTEGLSQGPFRQWRVAGRRRALHFRSGGDWVSHGELLNTPDLPALGPWRVFQLTHFLSSLPNSPGYDRRLTRFEETCVGRGLLRHSLSDFYLLLVSPPPGHRPSYLARWEADLAMTFSDQQCSRIFEFTHKSSMASSYQEAGYKILTRWYHVPSKLHRLFPSASPACWRCGSEEGTLLHIFWECSILRDFWGGVHRVLGQIFQTSIPNTPAFFLLHLSNCPLRTYRKSSLRHMVNAARACIPALWKSSNPPSLLHWIRKVEDIQFMEDLTASLRDKRDSFIAAWTPWILFQGSQAYRDLTGRP